MSRLVTAPQLLGADDGSKRVGTRSRAKFIAAAAVGILVLGAAAALSPALDHVSGTTVLGLLLVAAGFLKRWPAGCGMKREAWRCSLASSPSSLVRS
jgi:hypothetical protein